MNKLGNRWFMVSLWQTREIYVAYICIWHIHVFLVKGPLFFVFFLLVRVVELWV